MKRFIVILLTLLSLNGKAQESVIIGGDNWCPINCGQDDAQKGFMIDAAVEAFAYSDIKVVYMEIPWTRAVGLARKGEIHAIVGAFRGDAPDFHFPQFPLLNITNRFFAMKSNSWQYSNIRSLNDVKLGSIKGYDYGDELNSYIQSVVDTEESNVHQMYGNEAVTRSIQFLKKGRIDVFVEAGPVFWYHAKQLGLSDKVQTVGYVSKPEPCFIAFSPNIERSKGLALALDKGVIMLKETKRLQAIAEKYGLPANEL